MRDFHWRRRHQQVDGIEDLYTPTANHKQPDQLKGRFRLNRASSTPGVVPLRKKQPIAVSKYNYRENDSRLLLNKHQTINDSYLQNSGVAAVASYPLTWLDGKHDPFDAFGLRLEGETLKLVDYYHRGYTLNIQALDVTDLDFFPPRPADSAKFHALLNLVAFDYTTRCGLAGLTGQDASHPLHLTVKAYQLVNQRIRDKDYSDATIAAVALIATKEVLSGNWSLAAQHIRGLEALVNERGGIKNISGLHQRVIAWADMCASTWRNSRPRISSRPSTSASPPLLTGSGDSRPSAIPSAMTAIVESLCLVSKMIDEQDEQENHETPQSQHTLSSRVFSIEHDIQQLTPVHSDTPSSAALSTVDLRVAPLCISAQLYLYLAIRQIPYQSQLIARLVKRLQDVVLVYHEVFPGAAFGHVKDDRGDSSDALLWGLFVGYAASKEGSITDQQWFEQKIRTQTNIAKSLLVETRPAILERRLKRFLWHEPWCRPHYLRLVAQLDY